MQLRICLAFWPLSTHCLLASRQCVLTGIQASCSPLFLDPSSQGCFKSIHCLACAGISECPDLVAGPCTWPDWISWSFHGPICQAWQHPSGWHPFWQAYQHNTQLHTCWYCTRSQCVLNKSIEKYQSWYYPWRASLFQHWNVDHHLWMQLSTQVLLHWLVHPSKPHLSNLEVRKFGRTISNILQRLKYCIEVQRFEKWGKSTCQWKQRQKIK